MKTRARSKWWLIALVVGMGLVGFSGLSVPAEPSPDCCHGGGGDDRDHPPKILNLTAPGSAPLDAVIIGSLTWEDKDGDFNWVESILCSAAVGCFPGPGWNPNRLGLKKGTTSFNIECVTTGNLIVKLRLHDKKNNKSGWGELTVNCMESSAPPSPPPVPPPPPSNPPSTSKPPKFTKEQKAEFERLHDLNSKWLKRANWFIGGFCVLVGIKLTPAMGALCVFALGGGNIAVEEQLDKLKKAIKDPPDPNFREIAQPKPTSMSGVPGQPDLAHGLADGSLFHASVNPLLIR